jgi:hypothetical protein
MKTAGYARRLHPEFILMNQDIMVLSPGTWAYDTPSMGCGQTG